MVLLTNLCTYCQYSYIVYKTLSHTSIQLNFGTNRMKVLAPKSSPSKFGEEIGK